MKLSLVIPVYNEGPHLKEFFDKLFDIKIYDDVEYVVIDDHSSDDSWDIIESVAKNQNITSFRQPYNQGKGAALHKGFKLASGDIIAVQDADFEYDPNDLPKLIKPIIEDEADVVYGIRFGPHVKQVHRTFHYMVNMLLTLFSNLMSGLYVRDMETCYKVFKAEIIKALELESKKFGFEPEVTAKISKLNIRMHQYPISYYPRGYIEGKKINWQDGVAALWFIIKFNLMPLSEKTLKVLPEKYVLNRKPLL